MPENSSRHPGCSWTTVESLLGRVERPSRYLGGEWNSPEIREERVRVVLAYPDVYEIGMSNLGLAILQEVANEIEGCSCERVFSPWVDMEREMRSAGVPLFSLETHRPVSGCDLFGISIPHELTCTNILNLIDLAGLPLLASEREGLPLVVGGGCGAANPEPLHAFFDLFILGEAEEALRLLVDLAARGRSERWSRDTMLEEASKLPGFYVPSRYEADYGRDGRLLAVRPLGGSPERIRKNIAAIDGCVLPSRPIVPFCEAVHDRLNVEIFRGCTRGCRFCQAGMLYRPVRERPGDLVEKAVREASASTGYDEVSLCSLSSTDYTLVEEVARAVSDYCAERRMSLALPSLRMDGFSVGLAAGLNRGGRGGVTFAPEAGTERLRRVINKPIREDDMADAVIRAVRAGRRRVKLYFMIGLPTETDGDVEEISGLVFRLRDLVRKEGLPPPSINVSVSTFVPKPHTPFQWSGQERLEAVERKQNILKAGLRARSVNLSWHDRHMSAVESLLARGDRRLSPVIEKVWRDGARFESWSEHFDSTRWEISCREAGIELEDELYRERSFEEVLPWDHLDYGLDRGFLEEECRRAIDEKVTRDCRDGECARCGVCDSPDVFMDLKGEWR